MPRRLLAVAALCLSALALTTEARAVTDDGPLRVAKFMEEIFKRVPSTLTKDFTPIFWQTEGNPTKEGIGLLKTSGADVDELARLVMDVDHYVGNLDYVLTCRSKADARFTRPSSVRFYQLVNIPMVNRVQHELVLKDGGTRNGYRVVYWHHLGPETAALKPEEGARSEYSVGVWLLSPNAVGYGLSNAPVRGDLSDGDWGALTTGADLIASRVVKENIKGLLAWAARTP